MKKFFLVICFIIVNFDLLYANGTATDDAARWTGKRLPEEVLRNYLKRANNAILLAADNEDNWTKLLNVQAYESSETALRKADDAAWRRNGIDQRQTQPVSDTGGL